MEQKSEIIKLYEKGKLGDFPLGTLRVRAALMLMRDYRFSLFSSKLTRTYDGVRGGKGNGAAYFADSRQDAADRYLGAVNAVGKYKVYLLHFLRDDKNVRTFVLENPVLNNNAKTTYNMVYAALCAMLDLLMAYYDGLQQVKAG